MINIHIAYVHPGTVLTTLILTIGDSAKSFAKAGIEIVGWDKYGLFNIAGNKLHNVNLMTVSHLKNRDHHSRPSI